MDLKRRFLSLMVSGDLDSEAGSLTVIARAVMPDDFVLLTPLGRTLPYLDDLCSAGEVDDTNDIAADAAASGSEAMPEVGDGSEASSIGDRIGSWIDFVESSRTVA